MQRKRFIATSGIVGLVALGLSACSVGSTASTTATPSTRSAAATVVATPRAGQATTGQTAGQQPATNAITTTSQIDLGQGVTGTGEVLAIQDSDLTFQASGTVQDVLVKEGDVVTKGQVLARLDLRTFEQQLHQAQAQLDSAKAQQAGLTEAPKNYNVQAARAKLQAAQAALAQTQSGPKSQDVKNAQVSVDTTKINLQSTKDKLSLAKTQAEAAMNQAAGALTQAQARYAQAKTDWEYVQRTGNNPSNPTTTSAQGKASDNKVSDSARNNYYNTFVEAESAMKQAEQSVDTAQKSFETARQQEVTGVQVAEQEVTQAQTSLDKLVLPADADQIAADRANIAAAQAALQALNPDPTDAQKAQADSSIAQAQASLEAAQINREHAEIVAPYDGVIDVVNIDPGDPSSTAGQPAIRLVDVSQLKVDSSISDLDIAKVKMGQQVKVYADAIPGKAFTGKVSYIAPTATITGNVRSYLVRVTLDPQQELRAGMSVRVEVTTK